MSYPSGHVEFQYEIVIEGAGVGVTTKVLVGIGEEVKFFTWTSTFLAARFSKTTIKIDPIISKDIVAIAIL